MKKKYILLLIIGIIFIMLGSFIKVGLMDTSREEANKTKSIKKIKSSKSLSMMLETGAGTGVYEATTMSTWPTEGYIFNSELSKCENGGKLSWNDENNTVVMTGSTSDKCYVYFDKTVYLADYVKNQYTGVQGSNGLYLHNSSLTNGAGDNSYRYAGEDPNNYVCFGSDESICSDDNLFRIIGVIDNKIKLVKDTYASSDLLGTDGTYDSNNSYKFSNYNSCPSSTTAYTSSSSILRLASKNIIGARPRLVGCNDWNYSDLNTINLNLNYVGTIDNIYKSKIASVSWNDESSQTQKIGLISYKDYIYTFTSGYWTLSSGISYNGYNWFYEEYSYNSYVVMGYATISKGKYNSSVIDSVSIYAVIPNDFYAADYYVPNSSGYITSISTIENFYIKPAFYLTSDVLYDKGSGTSTDPIRLKI